MQITRLAIVRSMATIAIFLALAVVGAASFLALPINEFPKVNIPVVTVTTTYAGANPQEIETQITRPIEDAVAGLNSIDYITSTSGEGFSAVTVTFTDQADQTTISSDVERQVNSIVSNFPTGADRPVVLKVDLSQVPVMQLALIDDTLSPQQLYDTAHDSILPDLEQINGVSQVALVGGRKDEVHVSVDPTRLAAYGISLSQVQTALSSANTALPGGSISQGTQQFDVQVSGLYARPEDLGNVIVAYQSASATSSGSPIHVRDVATVSSGAAEQTQVTRVNGHQAILLAVGQQNGSNLTDVTDNVNRLLPSLQSRLSPGSQLIVVEDSTPFVRGSLNGIEEELITAVVLTSVVLLAFLHKPRAAVIVLFSIPTTLLTTFIAMRLLGFSLNFLSTLGLTLTIGILVDDSIVVLENILRHLGRGEPPFAAALMGRSEIGLAAVTITFVDVVVFAPTGLVSGQIGAFFREFGFTIASATLISLAVSFTLTPMLAAKLLRATDHESATGPNANALDRFGHWWDREFNALERRYERLLRWALRHRPLVIAFAAATVVFGLGLIAAGKVSTEFVPNADNGYFFVSTEAPPGTSLAAHDAAMREIEQILLGMPDVTTVSSSIGVSSSGFFGSGTTGQARFGTVTVQLKPLSSGRPGVDEEVKDARNRLAQVAGVKISVSSSGGGGSASQPVAVRLEGPDLGTLQSIASQLQDKLANTPGLINITNSAPAGQPQLLVQVDQARAAELGVSSQSLATAVRTAFSGVVATKYQRSDATLVDVRLELSSNARTQTAAVGDLPIQTNTSQTVPLSAVSNIIQTTGPTEIDRRDRQRVVTISADLDTGVTLGQVNPAVQRAMQQLQLPQGYTVSLGGSSQSQAQSFGQLFAALGASVMLAYLLMAVLYNSLTHPLVILFSLPAAIGGAIVGLLVFGYTFSIFAMIGMILLVGLAIKNGILLVDRTNHNRARGMDRLEALLEAGPARLRPILMTSTTIALALFPTALRFGEGAELRAPLAAAVLGGVISSTLLTLVLVPVMYTLLDGLPAAIGRGVARVAGVATRRRRTALAVPVNGVAHSTDGVARGLVSGGASNQHGLEADREERSGEHARH